MQRPKTVALALLVGALLAGFALGYGVAWARKASEGSGRDQRMRSSLARDLALSADQRRVMDSILDERNARMSVVVKPVQPQLDSLTLGARAAIRATLDPEQQLRFDAYVARQDSARSTK
ncbi:MAG TPA: hypothetical protein VHQ45_09380 [Gemmatimonadaceae bacterium]|jgi:hypothetical protein|nr:hypothetical protein [Gemmatimonadaceae bacterium]